MATPEFILQGFTANTHIDALQRLFDLPDVQSVLVSVALVSEGGVERLEAHLIPHRACATVFAGIRNGTTSYHSSAASRRERALHRRYGLPDIGRISQQGISNTWRASWLSDDIVYQQHFSTNHPLLRCPADHTFRWISARNMLRSSHGHDPKKVKTPHPAAAYGVAPREVARAGTAAGAALGAGFARSQGAGGDPP